MLVSLNHYLVFDSFFLWQKGGWYEFYNLKFCSLPPGMPCRHPNPTPLIVTHGWILKHPKHQCRHWNCWRNPAEDYPNIGRGEHFYTLVLFNYLFSALWILSYCKTSCCKCELLCRDTLKISYACCRCERVCQYVVFKVKLHWFKGFLIACVGSLMRLCITLFLCASIYH